LRLPEKDEAVTPETFGFHLSWQNLRETRRREGSYLLRSNLTGGDPGQLWAFYLQLTEVEQAFKELKGDLAIRPIYHQTDERIKATIWIAAILSSADRGVSPGASDRSRCFSVACRQ
jgi:hypothetical protein